MFRPLDHPITIFLARLGLDEDDLLGAADSELGGRLAPTGHVIRFDGATGGYQIVAPPPGREGVLRRLKFWQVRRDQATAAFNAMKRALVDPRAQYVWDARSFGPGSGNAVEDLKHLQSLVLGFRTVIAKLDAMLELTPEVSASRAREEAERSRADAAEAARLETARLVREITI